MTSELVVSAIDIRLIGIRSMNPLQEPEVHVKERLQELSDLINMIKDEKDEAQYEKLIFSSTKYAVSKIIRRAHVGLKWKLTATLKTAAKADYAIFSRPLIDSKTTDNRLAEELRWVQQCAWLIKPYQFEPLRSDLIALWKLKKEHTPGPTVYTGEGRQKVCRVVWMLISLYYALADAVARRLERVRPTYHNKEKWNFECLEVDSDKPDAPSDDDLIDGLNDVGTIIFILTKLAMFEELARDLGIMFENGLGLARSERPKEPLPTQPDIHLPECPTPGP